ncbi:FCD domain-containing protein [Hyphomicrobium sp.]|uniref:FCD domain-containing protein n=1 Tax=Hyphomicrobium sp. TaxID=82 RepID=UPI002E311895|nr:FCD domain-containing protein [Hyphomicrobium sp.]HEX2839669.1 FCD domain-containing protein [Hyphomicrobium sp.]
MQAIRTQRVADAIATRIEKLILEGALRPGEKLASERELAQRLDVSRPSLREAIDKLVDRGLLTAGRGGTSVAQFLLPIMTPLANLYRDHKNAAGDYLEFRQWVEAQAAQAAAERATEVDKAAIRACLADMRKAHKSKDSAQEAQADVNLHIRIYEASHNFIVLHVMRALSELLRDNVFFNREHLYGRAGVREKLLAQHVEIGEAVIAGDPERAEKAAATHIQFVFGTVEDIQRDDQRLECSISRVGRNDFLAER